MTIIRFRRGNKADLPTSAPSGMPLWCEDTKRLYLGTGDDVHLIGENLNIASDLVPYSVNSGNVDSNGYADLISKVSDTEIAFKVGGAYPNMGITFPNGNHYIISSIANINGLNDNTEYIFVIYEDNLTDNYDNTYSAIVSATISSITEDIVLPNSSINGDLALLINQKPLKPYLKQDSDWEEKQFIKIGEVTKIAGIFGSPISYTFNGLYISQDMPIPTFNTKTTISANIGSYFVDPEIYIRNITPQLGYIAGEITKPLAGGAILSYFPITVKNKKSLTFIQDASNGIVIANKSNNQNVYNASVTYSYWKMFFIVKRGF